MRSSNTLAIDSTLVLDDVEGVLIDASQVMAASLQMVITGTGQSAPTGNIILQVSDDPPLATEPTNWSTGATLAVGAAGTFLIPKTDISYQWMRAYYDNTVSIAAATLTNQSLTYTALVDGASGNLITIRLLDPSAINQSLSVTVTGTAITVHLATDGSGVITSTPTLIKAAVNASVASMLLLIPVTGSGSSAVTALAATPLATGRDGGTITSTRIKSIGF